jgi:hypothetical protein
MAKDENSLINSSMAFSFQTPLTPSLSQQGEEKDEGIKSLGNVFL